MIYVLYLRNTSGFASSLQNQVIFLIKAAQATLIAASMMNVKEV